MSQEALELSKGIITRRDLYETSSFVADKYLLVLAPALIEAHDEIARWTEAYDSLEERLTARLDEANRQGGWERAQKAEALLAELAAVGLNHYASCEEGEDCGVCDGCKMRILNERLRAY